MDNYTVEHIKVKPDEIVVLRYDIDKLSVEEVQNIFIAYNDLVRENNEFPYNIVALPSAISIETMSPENIFDLIEQLNKFAEGLHEKENS